MNSTLLVIGNGFDKYLGLNSSFSDFFNYLKTNHHYFDKHLNDNDWGEFSSFDVISVWPFIITFNYKGRQTEIINWTDVEKQIKDFFTLDFKSEENKQSINFGILYDLILKIKGNLLHSINTKPLFKVFSLDVYKHASIGNIYDYRDIKPAIIDYLYKELNKFEKLFNEYLLNDLGLFNKDKYEEMAEGLVNTIVSVKNNNHLSIDKISILNFNYTSVNNKNISFLRERNLHGKLNKKNSNIIFGIDSKSFDSDSSYFKFTKTSRILNDKLVNNSDMVVEIPEYLDTIYFFGHSLSEQDYSYFQSIFDTVNLYKSKTELIFVYSLYQDSDEEKNIYKNQLASSISRLIEEYGRSFETEIVKGKNLLHRLILENRIHILELPNVCGLYKPNDI